MSSKIDELSRFLDAMEIVSDPSDASSSNASKNCKNRTHAREEFGASSVYLTGNEVPHGDGDESGSID
jgi:hypothetical protein